VSKAHRGVATTPAAPARSEVWIRRDEPSQSLNAVPVPLRTSAIPAKNVKNWQDGQMALRWCAAGMVEAGKQFRRVNGHMHLTALRASLQRVTTETVVSNRQNETVNAA
jgi:putative transposase